MPRLRANKGSNKQVNYITNYTVSIANSIVKESGYTLEDELTVTVEDGKIIIQKIFKKPIA